MVAADKLEELRASIAVARKRPMAFGLCLGKSPATTLLLSHKTKEPEVVGRLAKKEGETNKIAFGMMTVNGKVLNLACEGDIPPGLARKTREMLRGAGLKLKVRLLDAEGNVSEEDGDDDEDEDASGAADAETAVAADDATPEVSEPEQDDAEADNPERARWLAEVERLRPGLAALDNATTPEAKKAAAYWAFAQSKAEGPPPDYAAALKSVGMLARMIASLPPASLPPAGPAIAETAPPIDPEKAQRNRELDFKAIEVDLRLLRRCMA